MGRYLLALVFIVLSIVQGAPVQATYIRDGDYEMRGTYQGVLFCSDCPGVWTEVTLEDNGPNIGVGHGTFVMTERYSGGVHKGESVLTTGIWHVISPDKYFTSGLLELQPARSGMRPRYFRCEGGRRLSEANPNGTPISDHLQQSALTRVIPQQIPTFAALTEAQANRTVYGRVGDRFSVDLTPKPAPGATPNPKPDVFAFALVAITQVPRIPPALQVYGGDAFADVIAANPGTARLTFRSRSKPVRLVTFDFEISP